MSIEQKYLSRLRQQFHVYAGARRRVIDEANNALHVAKRAIFSLHRQNTDEAKERLQTSELIIKNIQVTYKKNPHMLEEGAYRAALEEYVEAQLFFQFVTTGKIGKIGSIDVPADAYVAGLSDVPGELYRYAISAATRHDMATVKKCAETAEEIIGELVEFDLTSYLRTKFDQAKQAAHKLKEVVYEVSLRTSI